MPQEEGNYLETINKKLQRKQDWYSNNRNRVKEYNAEYRREHKAEIRKQENEYRRLNRAKRNKKENDYYKKNQTRLNDILIAKRLRNINSWIGLIPKETVCQCCNTKIIFASGDGRTSIHFDHRSDQAKHIKSPTHWLSNHRRTFENELVWIHFNFGMLCMTCNKSLPTLGRTEWLEKAMAYAKTR